MRQKQKPRQFPTKEEAYALGRNAQKLMPGNKAKVLDLGLSAAEQTNKHLVPLVAPVKKDSPAGPDVSTLRPLRVVRRKKRART
jgi:hypothetical protein